MYEIDNDWAADFCKTNPRRFVGLACVPNLDTDKLRLQFRLTVLEEHLENLL